MKGYTLINNVDVTNGNLSDKSFRLYMLLLSMAYGKKTMCYPSQKYLAEKLNCSVRTIQRHIKELVLNNLIKVKRRGSISNIYILINKQAVQQVENTRMKVESKVNKNNNNKYKYKYKQNEYKQRKYKQKQGKSIQWHYKNQRTYDYVKLEKALLARSVSSL